MDFNTTTSLNSINTNHITTPSTSATPITESLSSTTTENTDSILATILTDSSTTATSTLQLLILTGILTKEQLTMIPSPLLGNILPIVYLIINGKYQLLESLLQLNIIDRTITYFLYPPTSSTSLTLSTSLLQTNPISTSSTTLPPSTTSPLIIATSDLLLSTEQSFLESYLHAYQFACQSNNGDSNNNINNNYTNNNNNTNHIDQHHYKTIYQLACYAPLHLFIPTIHILYNYGYNIHQHTSQNLTLLQTLVLALFQPRLNNGDEHLQLISMLIQFQVSQFNMKDIRHHNSSPPLYELAIASGSMEICKYISTQKMLINFDPTNSLPLFIYAPLQSIEFIHKIIQYHSAQYLPKLISEFESRSSIILEIFIAISQFLTLTHPSTIPNYHCTQIHSTTITSFYNYFLNLLLHFYYTHFISNTNSVKYRLKNNATIFHPILTHCTPTDSTSIICNFINSPTFDDPQITEEMQESFTIFSRTTDINNESLLELAAKMGNYEVFTTLYSFTFTLDLNFDMSPKRSTLLHHIASLPPTLNNTSQQLIHHIVDSEQFLLQSDINKCKYIGHQNHLGETSIDVAMKSSNCDVFEKLWSVVTSAAILKYHPAIFHNIIYANPNTFTSFINSIISSSNYKSLPPPKQSLLLHYANQQGQTIFDICIQSRQFKLFNSFYSLFDPSTSKYIKEKFQINTALHSLARSQEYEFIIQFMLQSNLNENYIAISNYLGQTAFDIAIQNRNDIFLDLLRSQHYISNQAPLNTSTQHIDQQISSLHTNTIEAPNVLHYALHYSFLFEDKQFTLNNILFNHIFDSSQFTSVLEQEQLLQFIFQHTYQGQTILQIATITNNFEFIHQIDDLLSSLTQQQSFSSLLYPSLITIYTIYLQHYITTSHQQFSKSFITMFEFIPTIPISSQHPFNTSFFQQHTKFCDLIFPSCQAAIFRQDYNLFILLQPALVSRETQDIDLLWSSVDISNFGINNLFTAEEAQVIQKICQLNDLNKYPSLNDCPLIKRQRIIMILRVSNPFSPYTNIVISKLIQIAIEAKEIGILQNLLNLHAITDITCFQSIVQSALDLNDEKMFQMLHEGGLDLQSTNPLLNNTAPFYYAINHQKMQICNYLLTNLEAIGVGPFSTSIQSPLHIGQHHHTHNLPGYSFYHLILQLPIEQQELLMFKFYRSIQSESVHQSIKNLGFNPYSIDSCIYNTYSALFMACVQGNTDSVKLLFNIGSIFTNSINDETILMAIACSGQKELFTYIMDLMHQQRHKVNFDQKYFDINYQSKVGHNVLSLAVSYNRIELVQYLASKFVTSYDFKSTTTGINLLHCATFTKNESSLQCLEYIYPLVTQYLNIDDVDNDGNTPLFTAVMNNNNIAYDFLITHQANPSFIRQDGRNLFHAYAIYHSNQSTIDDLYDLIEFIQNGAQDYQFRSKVFFSIPNLNVCEQDISGLTPNALCYIQIILNSIKKQNDDLVFYKLNQIKPNLPKVVSSQVQEWLSTLPELITYDIQSQLVKLISNYGLIQE